MPRAARAGFAVFGVLLVAYFVVLVVRPADQSSTLLDGWGVDAFELLVCTLGIGVAFARGSGRPIALSLGGSMLLWSLGDVARTVQSLGGTEPPVPSVPDLFYLLSFPVAYLGLGLMIRRALRSAVPATWLDGVIAGVGAATLCSAFAFHDLRSIVGGGAAEVATNLAYPIGDVLLLAMAVGGTVLLSGRRQAAWYLVATGCAVNAFGDTLNLLSPAGAAHLTAVADGIAWPTAIWLVSLAVALPAPKADLLENETTPGFALPGAGAIAAVGVLIVGTTRSIDRVSVALAAVTIGLAAIRLGLSTKALRRLMNERRRQSLTDTLTGLGNRRRLGEALEHFFGEDDVERRLAFLFVDLDGFKQVNDSFGHAAGDQLLVQLGPRVVSCLRDSDLVARIGGDELAVLLVDADAGHAAEVAQRISAKIREPFVLDTVSVRIEASVGIAVAPLDAVTAADLMKHADQAMYRAKKNRSAVEFYDRALDTETDRLRLLEDLRAAIAAGELVLHYQPQFSLLDGTMPRVEALLRWPHPRLGFVPPPTFLLLAEEAGLMRTVTDIVLRQALAQCARWRTDGRDIAVSVNVSATDVQDVTFAERVRRHLAEHDLPAAALRLEITETTVISDFARCQRVIDELRELGCTISMDDFGAGFTSLANLGRLALDELKLDRRFLAAAQAGRGHTELLRATIELAHALGLEVVAEGVEEEHAVEVLARLGCDLAQGYHLGRPAPADEVWRVPALPVQAA